MPDDNNGYQRRRFDLDHDLLVQIHTIVTELKDQFTNEKDWTDKRFTSVHSRINEMNSDVGEVSNKVSIGIGICLAISVIVPIIIALAKSHIG